MTLAILIVIVLINAGGRAMYYSAAQAIVPELVESNALEHANGVLSGTEAGAEDLAGPVVGTWLFAVSKAIPFFADAVVTLLSCIPLVGFRSKAPRPEGASTSAWEGARLLFADRRLRLLLIMVGSLAGLQGMEAGILVLLTTKVWGVGEGAYGVFLAAGAAGTLVGSLGANRMVRRIGNGQTLIGAALVSGVGYLVMAAANGWELAGPAFAVVGLAIGAGSVVAISLRQRLTPPDLMGRVGGAWRGLVWGAAPVGALAAGGLAAIWGLRLPLVLAGVLQCAVGLLLARPLLRSLRLGSDQSRIASRRETRVINAAHNGHPRCRNEVKAASRTHCVAGTHDEFRRASQKAPVQGRLFLFVGVGAQRQEERIRGRHRAISSLQQIRRYLNRVRGWRQSHHLVRKVGGLHGYDECSRRRVRQA